MEDNKPYNIDINFNDDKITVTISRASSKLYLLIFVCFFWNIITIFFSIEKLKQGTFTDLFPLPGLHLVAGFSILYYTIAEIMNKLVVKIDKNQLTISDINLPLGNNRKISILDIKQFCSITKTGGKRGYKTYQVNAIYKNGKRKNIINGLETKYMSDYIVENLNRHLNLEEDTGEEDEYMALDTPRQYLPVFIISSVFLIIYIFAHKYGL